MPQVLWLYGALSIMRSVSTVRACSRLPFILRIISAQPKTVKTHNSLYLNTQQKSWMYLLNVKDIEWLYRKKLHWEYMCQKLLHSWLLTWPVPEFKIVQFFYFLVLIILPPTAYVTLLVRYISFIKYSLSHFAHTNRIAIYIINVIKYTHTLEPLYNDFETHQHLEEYDSVD